MTTLYLHPQIEEALKAMEEKRKKLLAMSPHLSRVERIAKEALKIEEFDRKRFTVFTYSNRICVSWTLQSYTDAIPLLTALAKEGWKRAGKMEKGDDYFTWKLTFEARPGLSIELDIDGHPPENDDTAKCRRVRTGTKLVEVAEYEIQCDEAEPSLN